MGRIVATEFVSLDGVMEDPGGAEDFRHGGWTFAIDRGEEGDQFKLEEVRKAEGLLLGRRTYEGFASAWPSMKGEFADKFNSMPKYVVSSTLERAEWSNSTILSGNLVDEITKLREAPGGELLINGSATLVQALLERDLLDEIRLMVFPVVLGAGRRLFGELSEKKPLRLADSQTVGAGITVLTLQPRAEAADPAGADA